MKRTSTLSPLPPFQIPADSKIRPDAPIGVIDTGTGGDLHAAHLKQIYPGENIVVHKVNDFQFAGNQKLGDIALAFHRGIAELLDAEQCKVVHVCCNSASCALYRAGLLASDNTQVQSLVRPAIRLSLAAARRYPAARHALMATSATLDSKVYKNELEELMAFRGIRTTPVTTIPVPILIGLIEQLPVSDPAIRFALELQLAQLESMPEILGLFCSHLELLAITCRDVFLRHGIRLLLPGRQLATETGSRLARQGLLNCQGNNGFVRFRSTRQDAAATARMDARFHEFQALLSMKGNPMLH